MMHLATWLGLLVSVIAKITGMHIWLVRGKILFFFFMKLGAKA